MFAQQSKPTYIIYRKTEGSAGTSLVVRDLDGYHVAVNEARHRDTAPPARRLVAIAGGALFFAVVIPWLFATAGARADQALRLPRIANERLSLLLGSPLILFGLFFTSWAVSRLFSLGRGTPLPFMPTRELVVRPPYSYCRNPMAFGVILYYLGLGLATGSVSVLAFASLFAGGLVVYVKTAEETELERRFGERYVDYKSRTPFLVPKPW